MTTLPPESNDEQPTGQAPEQPPVAPAAPAAAEVPAAPAAPQPEAPQYQAPPAGAYQAPPAGAYQAPPAGGYQQPAPAAAADPVSNITLNYWLSVFFTWLPALIFWLIEKDKGNQVSRSLHVANLNFSLLRTGVWVAAYILAFIPAIGWLLALLLWIGQIVLFVFHILGAVKAPESYRRGDASDPFILNIPLVK